MYDPRANTNDPFAGLNPDNLPEWAKHAAGEFGKAGSEAMGLLGNAPVLGGLLQASAVPAKYGAGLAGMGADAFLGTGLNDVVDKQNPDMPFWMKPLATQDTLFNQGFQGIAEDPNAPAWSRVAAQIPRGAELMGELRAPLPGVGAAMPLIKGEGLLGKVGAAGAREGGALRGLVGEMPKGGAKGALKQLGGDLIPGYRELQTAKALISKVSRPGTTAHAIGPEATNEINSNMLVSEAQADVPSDPSVPYTPTPEHIRHVQTIEALQRAYTPYKGKAVADMTVGEMWKANDVSYENINEARAIAHSMAQRITRGVPGLTVTPSNFGGEGGFTLVFRDANGDGVALAEVVRAKPDYVQDFTTAQTPDPETGASLKVQGMKVNGMYLDLEHPALRAATQEMFGRLNEMRAFTGGTMSYWSATLTHRMSVENRLSIGGEVPDKVLKEIDPVRTAERGKSTPFYPEYMVRKMKRGSGNAAVNIGRTTVSVDIKEAPASHTRGLVVAHQQIGADVAKRNGVELRQTKMVSSDNGVNGGQYVTNGVQFTFVGKDVAKMENAARELGHLYDSPVDVYHYNRPETTGTPFGEASFVTRQSPGSLADINTLSKWALENQIELVPDENLTGGQGGFTIRAKNVDADAWALFIDRVNDRLMATHGDVSAPMGNARMGRVVEFPREATTVDATGTGRDAALTAEAGGTGQGPSPLGARGSARDINPRSVNEIPRTAIDRSSTPLPDPDAPGSIVRPDLNGVITRSDPLAHRYSSYDSTAYDDLDDLNNEPPDSSTPLYGAIDDAVADPSASDLYTNDGTYAIIDRLHSETTNPDGSRIQAPVVSTQNGVRVVHTLRSDGAGGYVEGTVPLDDIRAVNNHSGDPLYDNTHLGSSSPDVQTGWSPRSHAVLEQAINDTQAVRVLDSNGTWHELPENLNTIEPGGLSLRVEGGSARSIPRSSIVEVVDTAGLTMWSRDGNAGGVNGEMARRRSGGFWSGGEPGEMGSKQAGAALGIPQAQAVGRAAVGAVRRLRGGPREGVVQPAAPGPDSPFITGGPSPEPHPLTAVPNDEVTPGSRPEIGPPGPARFGEGIPAQTIVETPETVQMQHEMTTPATPNRLTNLGERLTEAADQQTRRVMNITRGLAENERITGADAEELVNGLRRQVQEGTVTAVEMAKVEKILEPVITAQRFYESVKDINDQIAGLAKQALDVAERERGAAVRSALGIQRTIARTESIGIAQEIRTQERINTIAEQHAMRVDRIMEATKKAVDALANNTVDEILRTVDELDAAIGDSVHGTPEARAARPRVLSDADAARLAREGYLSPPDKELLDRLGFNTGKYHPTVAARIAHGIRENMAEYERVNSTRDTPFTREDALQGAARYVGVDPEVLAREAEARGLQRGELTTFMVGLRLGVVQAVKELQKLERSGASNAELLKAHGEFQEFLVSVGGAQSEVGRALSEQKQTITKTLLDAYGERGVVGQMRKRTVDAEALREKAAMQVAEIKAKYDGLLARATTRADKALTASEQQAAASVKRELDKAQKALDIREATLVQLRSNETAAIARAQTAIDNYKDAAMQSMLADADSIDALKAILKLENKDLGYITNVVRNIKKVSRGDKLIAYVSNNAYSGIAAQEGNALSPFLRLAHHIIETRIAETAGGVYTKVTGREAAIAPGETRALLRGIKSALTQAGSGETVGQKVGQFLGRDEAIDFAAAHFAPPKALEVMMDTMLNGHANEASSRMQDLAHPNIIKGKAGAVFQFWLRTNGAFDAFGKHLFNVAEQEALYTKYARASLLKEGEELTAETVALRVAHLLADPPAGVLEQAAEIANRTAYQGKQSVWAEKVFSSLNHRFDIPGLGGTPILKAVFLASRFTWAATMYSLETTPLGLIKAANRIRSVRTLTEAGDLVGAEAMAREAARMGARGAVGSAATVWAMQMYSAGTLIGKDPEGLGHDDTIKLGDTYVPLKQLWPISAPLIYTAHTADKWHEADVKDEDMIAHIAGMAEGWGEALGNQPVMRGIFGIVQATKYGGDSAARLVANITGRLVPYSAFDRDVARIIDNIDRDPRGNLLDLWKENLPMLSFQVNPKINRWGEAVVNKPEGLARLNPFASTGQDHNPGDIELARLHNLINPDTGKPYLDTISPPMREIGNVKLDANEHTEWQGVLGQARQKAIIDLVQTQRYTSADPKEQARLINSANSRATLQATRDFAASLLAKPDTASQVKGLRIGIGATPGNYDRVKLVEKAVSVLDANPDLVKQFDALRQPDDLTYKQYKEALRMLPTIEKQPEFSYFNGAPIGTPEIWDQYHDELKQYNQLIKDGRKSEANIYLARHTVLRQYRNLAQRPMGKNAIVTRMRKRYPILSYIRLPMDADEDEPTLVRNPVTQTNSFGFATTP